MQNLPIIRTARTVLQVLTPEDGERLLAFQLENQAHFAPWEPARKADFFTLGAARSRLELSYAASCDGAALQLAALDPDSGKMLAGCNFTNIVHGVFQACHLGYSVAKSAEGTGLMYEVLHAAIGHMFEQGGLHRIMANHLPANTRSAALLQRLGFEREGYARAYLKINGQWEDMILNSLLNPLET